MSNHAMSHGIYRVVDFEFMGNYSLRVSFDDGVTTLVDLEPVLEGELYGPLRDPAMFKTAHIDPEVHTLVWANGADFDPATLHDWPEVAEDFARMASRWKSSAKHHDDSAG
jgi:hypothetical protein